jgi:serine/threonine-protein kinase RsbW
MEVKNVEVIANNLLLFWNNHGDQPSLMGARILILWAAMFWSFYAGLEPLPGWLLGWNRSLAGVFMTLGWDGNRELQGRSKLPYRKGRTEMTVREYCPYFLMNHSRKSCYSCSWIVLYLSASGRADMSSEAPEQCEFDSDKLLVKLDTTLPADISEIAPVTEKIMAVVREMGCAAGREFEIQLALGEALANAIVHGSAEDPSKRIQCCVACDQRRGMLIVVRDPGPGFDPASIPSPIVGRNIFATGGRGIYLINQLMDEVRFEKGGTEIHMRVHPPRVKG